MMRSVSTYAAPASCGVDSVDANKAGVELAAFYAWSEGSELRGETHV